MCLWLRLNTVMLILGWDFDKDNSVAFGGIKSVLNIYYFYTLCIMKVLPSLKFYQDNVRMETGTIQKVIIFIARLCNNKVCLGKYSKLFILGNLNSAST